MKSSMAAPSLRNSGLLATSQSRPVSSRSRAATAALVPTGTVLLITTTASRGQVRRDLVDHRPEGRQIDRAVVGRRRAHGQEDQLGRAAAAARSVVKRSRPASAFRGTNSASPGS